MVFPNNYINSSKLNKTSRIFFNVWCYGPDLAQWKCYCCSKNFYHPVQIIDVERFGIRSGSSQYHVVIEILAFARRRMAFERVPVKPLSIDVMLGHWSGWTGHAAWNSRATAVCWEGAFVGFGRLKKFIHLTNRMYMWSLHANSFW